MKLNIYSNYIEYVLYSIYKLYFFNNVAKHVYSERILKKIDFTSTLYILSIINFQIMIELTINELSRLFSTTPQWSNYKCRIRKKRPMHSAIFPGAAN